ncbi:hypothetical protein HaLaN_03476 [Haematococcus lacustris]|uniref:Uncharacterized protein n=1 Tax=Haematococcus lacustris TaxID=44745 RepID=A0A699YEM5_HAELA|nr:hypothetical protein HaLaN_03476 [Haematococcus lacustris]
MPWLSAGGQAGRQPAGSLWLLRLPAEGAPVSSRRAGELVGWWAGGQVQNALVVSRRAGKQAGRPEQGCPLDNGQAESEAPRWLPLAAEAVRPPPRTYLPPRPPAALLEWRSCVLRCAWPLAAVLPGQGTTAETLMTPPTPCPPACCHARAPHPLSSSRGGGHTADQGQAHRCDWGGWCQHSCCKAGAYHHSPSQPQAELLEQCAPCPTCSGSAAVGSQCLPPSLRPPGPGQCGHRPSLLCP